MDIVFLPEKHRSKYYERHLDLELENLLEHKSVPGYGIPDSFTCHTILLKCLSKAYISRFKTHKGRMEGAYKETRCGREELPAFT